MQNLKLLMVVGVAAFLLQGCHTMKGFQQDVKETVDGISGKNPDGWLQKTDRWMKDKMW